MNPPYTSMKKPYYLHWCSADPFGYLVVVVVGDYKAATKELDRRFKSSSGKPYSDGMVELLDTCPPWDRTSERFTGRTVFRKNGGDILAWFPTFPSAGTLAHEILHSVQHVLRSAGVHDTEGEADAYLLGEMVDHFTDGLEKDKHPRREINKKGKKIR